jgi:hypothetical protein
VRRLALSLPAKEFPVLEPARKCKIHLRFLLERGKGRKVQEMTEDRLLTSSLRVSAKKEVLLRFVELSK